MRNNKSGELNKPNVRSYGISGAAGWNLDVNGGVSYVTDDSGQEGIAITVGIGGGLGYSYGISIMTNSNYNSIADMEGFGASIGGTIAHVGMEGSIGQKYGGMTLSVWFSPSLEFHANISYTWVIYF